MRQSQGHTGPTPVSILALNPAIDMTYEVDRLLPDQKVHAASTRFDPGGNGINVARALKRLQVPAHTFCVLAGEMGAFLQRLLAHHIDDLSFEEVPGETRINGTTIEYHTGAQYEVSGPGPRIPDATRDRLLRGFVDTTEGNIGVLTGSLQPGLPDDLYGDLAVRIRALGGRAVIDAQGELLRRSIEANPFLIKPNHYELEQLTGKVIDGIEEVAAVAREIQRGGVECVCVSLGPEGAVLTYADNSLHAKAPKVDVASTVGAGDSMVAGMVAALKQGQEMEEALRLGIACSAGTVQQPGTELFAVDALPKLMDRIDIRRLDI